MRVREAHLFLIALLCVSCGRNQTGVAELQRYGCGSCHTVPGVPGATGKVGPSLAGIGAQRFIAGQLANTPDNMVHWIQHPRAVNEKTDMPELGVTTQDAQNISSLLYTLR